MLARAFDECRESRKTLEREKMTRLIRYEFYKLFCRRSILVVLILFGVINLFKINNEFHSYSYLADGNDSKHRQRSEYNDGKYI